MRTETLAVVFTDIKGYTAATSKQSHQENASMLRRTEGIVAPVVRSFSGRVIKSIGDAYMIVFRSPTDAVRCATAVQDRLFEHNRSAKPGEGIHIRIAINVGEVRIHRGDVFGDPVNIAARIESITPADEIYFAQAVYLTMNRSDLPIERVADYELKGLPEPVTVYRIKKKLDEAQEGAEAGKLRLPYGGTELEKWHRMRWVRLAYLAMWCSVALGLAVGGYFKYRPRTDYTALFAAMKVAIEEKKPMNALGLAGQVPATAVQESAAARRYRRQAVRLLIEQGDRDTANAELGELLKSDPRDAEALMLSATLQIQRGEKLSEAFDSLAKAVSLDPTLVEQEAFVSAVVQGYHDNNARKIADQIVAQYIMQRAVPELRRMLTDGLGDRTTQNAIADRLEKLGAGDEVDWVALAIEDLKSTSCKVRRNAISRLLKERDERAVGPLMKLAAMNTCGSSNAKQAAEAILAK